MNKKIKILSGGAINSLKGINGPIYNPFITDTTSILNILFEGHKVIEVLSDGTEVELDILNYEKDLDREHLLEVDRQKRLEEVENITKSEVSDKGYISNKNKKRKERKNNKVDELES